MKRFYVGLWCFLAAAAVGNFLYTDKLLWLVTAVMSAMVAGLLYRSYRKEKNQNEE